MANQAVDVLAVGAHPDDVEVGVGALVRKLASEGNRVGILDLTRGELSSRGTVEERRDEAAAAARVLGIARRENAALPDGGIANTPDMRLALVPLIRSFRPRVLIAPMSNDRHPDHDAAHVLVRDANYAAGLTRIDTGQEPWRAPYCYYYRVYFDPTPPDIVIDVSKYFEAKREALRQYSSQLFNPDYDGAETYVSSERFWESIRIRAEYWGSRIGVAHGEPLYTIGPIGLSLLPGLEEAI